MLDFVIPRGADGSGGSSGGGEGYAGTWDIPGAVPGGVQKISQYTVTGNTTVSDGEVTNADGTLTLGDDVIDLPVLGKWDTLTAQANGVASITRQSSQILYLKDMEWAAGTSNFNDVSVYFIGSTELDGAGTHADSTVATDVISNMTLARVNGNDGVMSATTELTDGLAVGAKNMLRVRVSRQAMLDAGCETDEVETVTGFVKWATANNIAIVYQLAEPATESTTLSPLTETSGVVALTGGYAGGTMTAVATGGSSSGDLAAQIAALEQRVAALEAVGG